MQNAQVQWLYAGGDGGTTILPVTTVITGKINLQIVSRQPAQRNTRGNGVIVTQIHAIKGPGDIAVLIKRGDIETSKEVIRYRDIDGAAHVDTIIGTVFDIDLAAKFFIGLLAVQNDRATDGISAEQCTLWTT